MGIDIKYATAQFREFLKDYDPTDDMVKLKIVHTMAVRNSCEYIADQLGLGQEDKELAVLIGLLHDIGRFDQIKTYHSFVDAETVDHAVLGLQMLFERGMIRRFIADDCYDHLIYTAIANHNRFAIEEGLDERSLLHAKIIRDADKLDNYRVKLEDKVENMLGVDAQAVGASYITDCVYDAAMRCESIYSPSRKTPVDIWVSYLAVTFDIYFDCSLELIHKNGWIDQITDRIQYTNPDTHTKIQHIRQNVLNYINERIEKHDKD